MKLYKILWSMAVLLLIGTASLKAQSPGPVKTKLQLFDGWLIAGYLDKGAYINCTGPSVKFSSKPICVLIGLLPGLRIKEDQVSPGSTRNSAITPSLGFGLTASFKHLALQLPLYYNSKTAAKDGQWKPGVGIGYKF